MADIRLVVSDLDGTFWSGHEVIHPDVRSAVDELDRRGVALLFATGRRLQSVRRGMQPAGIDRPSVLMSGALGADLGTGREWHRASFAPDDAAAVHRTFLDHGLEPVTYLCRPGAEALAQPDCASNEAHLASFGDQLATHDPEPWIEAGDVVGFGVIGSRHPRLGDVAASLAGIANVWHSVDDTYGGWALMVGPPGVTKVTGVEPWARQRGYAPHEVLAVGDGSNDFHLLDWAGVAVAVRDRPTQDRPHDAVIDPPEVAGWASLLDLV